MNRCGYCEINEETAYPPLVSFDLVVNDEETGFSSVVVWACDEHFRWLTTALMTLGFKDHRHDGEAFLDDRECPGFEDPDNCPHTASDFHAYGEPFVYSYVEAQTSNVICMEHYRKKKSDAASRH